MRAFYFPIVGLVALTACAAEETSPNSSLRRPGGTSAPGADNTNGEHGSNAPSGTTQAPDLGTSVGTETWEDGKTITGNVNIASDAMVAIAPGATITVSAGVAITVSGTLKTTPSSTLKGTGWTGVVIAAGGTLDADGLTITGADSALWPQAGNAAATFKNGTITSKSPFKMEPGSKLTITRSKVTAQGGSSIAGTFVASYLDYDKGTNGGLTINDNAGSMTISDSVLRGAGGGDYLISSGAKLVKVEYTTISGSHCPLHFTSVDRYVIDHVSENANAYGDMFYGSGAGPNSITASNFQNLTVSLDIQGTNGPLSVVGSYLGKAAPSNAILTITNAQGAPIADAKPR